MDHPVALTLFENQGMKCGISGNVAVDLGEDRWHPCSLGYMVLDVKGHL
jgi:hypothetical protein